ncbi:MAG: hypothetical protein RLZ12_522 [Bacillota bacterium]
MIGAEGGSRTHTPRTERDFESRASAYSATSAYYIFIVIRMRFICQLAGA